MEQETEFCRFYEAAQIFPDDVLIAVRTLPTMSALTGKKRAEKAQAANIDLLKKILTFEYPEGYDPDAPAEPEGENAENPCAFPPAGGTPALIG